MKYVVSYQLGPPDPYFHLFTVCYCTFTKIHTPVGLNSAWIQREIRSFLNLSSDLGEKETFWMLFRIISSFIFTRVWFSFDGRITTVSPRGARCILQQKPAEDSFIYLQKKVQSFRWSIWWTLEDGEQGQPSILDHQQTREAASWLAAVSSSLWFPVCAGGTGPGRGALLQTWGELQNSKVKRRRKRRTRGRRVTGSWCGQGVGADVEFPNDRKTCDSQQSLFLCDLRMEQQSNPRLQGASHNVFCTPCCWINWGSEALEVESRLQKVSSPPPSYTSGVTRCKFTAEELQRDQPKLEDAAPGRVSSHVQQSFSPQKLDGGDEKQWIVLTDYEIKQQWRIYHIPILLWET